MRRRVACAAIALVSIGGCASPSATPDMRDASGAGGVPATGGGGSGGDAGGAMGEGGAGTGGAGTGGGGGSAGSGVLTDRGCIGNGAPTLPPEPGTRIDFDIAGRATDEVSEPGWNAWVVAEAASDTKTFDGVKLTIAKAGSAGTGLESVWYKAGVQSPFFARLVGDGVDVAGGASGGAIQLTLSGLSAGAHTLLAYHNAIDGNVWAPINVDVNGTRQVSNLQPTNRATSTDAAALSYVSFDATAGKDTVILYSPSSSGSGVKNVIINGLVLDAPNPTLQAKGESPRSRDWHVDADSGSVTLSWIAAKGATAHNLYVGVDAAMVASATTSSPAFLGRQTATSYELMGPSPLRYTYWRVDEIDASGAVTKGSLWSFSPRHLAFPGAEGYGRLARGGRCGKVVHVTNLNDSGAGSLREAVESDIGPRIIVFDVAGAITLNGRLTLASDFTTVAGQTAPGKGIMIRSAPFGASGVHDSVMRFVRVRVGYIAGQTYDGTGMQGSDHSIFDHVSVSWTEDEAFSSRNAINITLQRTLIAEALNHADHTNSSGDVNQQHGFAATISGNAGSFHHNLLAHNEGRNWSMGAAIDGSGIFVSRLDLFNNLVYNWGGRATDGQAHLVNFVNNYYKEGPATRLDLTFSMDFENYGMGTLQAYYAGNILQKPNGTFTCDGKNNTCGRRYTLTNGNPEPTWNVFPTDAPFFPSYATIHAAADAYKSVLSDVGATMPMFDDHDQRIVKETLAGTATYKGSITGYPGLPDRETDVGGYESYPTTMRAADFDTDGDGLPDWYEAAIGTNPKSAKGDFSDSNADLDGDGYTNIEDYLRWMATPHADLKASGSTTFDLAGLFRGYTKSPSYKVGASDCMTATISNATLTVSPKGTCKIAYLPVTVTDGDNSTMTREVGVYLAP